MPGSDWMNLLRGLVLGAGMISCSVGLANSVPALCMLGGISILYAVFLEDL